MIFQAKGSKAILLFGLALTSIASAASVSKKDYSDVGHGMSELIDADGNSVGIGWNRKVSENDDTEMDNKLLSYEPMMNKIKYPEIEAYLADLQKPRESVVVLQKGSPTMVTLDQKKSAVVVPSQPRESEAPNSAVRDETIKLIAHNSREVRLMGQEEKEVEMKDDAATKMAVAIDNLKKEAGEVWGQVNTKLDKGWTDLKTMVEGAVESANKKSGPNNTSPLEDVAAGADTAVKAIKDQAEIAGTKIKGFLNNLGINV